MEKFAKRFTAFGVTVSFLFLAACSGGGSEGSSPGPSSTAAPSAEKPKETVSIKLMGNFSTANQSKYDQEFFKKVEQANNVKLDFIVPPASGYLQQLSLTLASGTYPDVVFFPNEKTDAYLSAVKDGLLIPLNKYLEKAPNLTKYTYPITWDGLKTKQDGNIYAIPRTTIARFDNFAVRKDWLNSIGFKVPDNGEITLEQFQEILRKFTFNDPDKNGKNDTYGLTVPLNANKGISPLLNSQNGNYGWQPASKGPYAYISPEYDQTSDTYKQILAFTQNLFKQKVLDPDSATVDANAASDRFKRGITGVTGAFAGHLKSIEADMKKINPSAELTYLFVQNKEGKLKGGVYGIGTAGQWGITKTAKYPEVIVQMFNWMLSDEGWNYVYYGVENMDYKVQDGQKAYDPEALTTPSWRKDFVRRSGDASFFIPPNLPKADQDALKPLLDKAVNSIVFSQDRGFVPPASKQQKYMDYKTLWDEKITKILIGELPVDAFDDVQKKWYENGGKEFVEQMNEYIKASTK